MNKNLKLEFSINKEYNNRLYNRNIDYLLLEDNKRVSKSKDINTFNIIISGDNNNNRREFISNGYTSLVESNREGDLGTNI